MKFSLTSQTACNASYAVLQHALDALQSGEPPFGRQSRM
jgi:hypothetical protein